MTRENLYQLVDQEIPDILTAVGRFRTKAPRFNAGDLRPVLEHVVASLDAGGIRTCWTSANDVYPESSCSYAPGTVLITDLVRNWMDAHVQAGGDPAAERQRLINAVCDRLEHNLALDVQQ